MGIKIRSNTLIGATITIDDIFRDGYKAIFIGTGVWKPRLLGIKGETFGNVHYAIDYLKNSRVYKLGKRVCIVGAGNVAMDVARTALRNGCQDVNIMFREGPENIESSEEIFKADLVILAIEQGPRSNIISNTIGIDVKNTGLVEVDEFGRTSRKGVFASGDVVTGAKTVVEAVRVSKKVAQAIDEYVCSILCDINGIVVEGDTTLNEPQQKIANVTNRNLEKGKLEDAIKNADVFIGVSAGNTVTKEMVQSMNKDSIIFALANPTPEIMPDEAKEAGARIIGTGRADFPNQINNVLVFPGIFKGALSARVKDISDEMKIEAAKGLANLVKDNELNEEYIIPSAFNEEVSNAVSDAVINTAIKLGVTRNGK
ncbi:FAD-dependent oxidoreductase [Clostridium sp. HBUAS56017]|uniref:FAD-dependent oxidoreductase n=1 Tax=Clostridium sp. HBUAS56017 TaxID=2571128 RepID=UPI001A9BEF8B|nr:FAD-dependent oxidoreductase [Clostridium sp. HBUAS56017]